MVFRRTAHAAYDTAYHLVWSPKYRKEILQGAIAERAREMFQEIADHYDITIEEMEVSPDHVHIFCFELLTAIPQAGPDQLQPITYLVGRPQYEECPLTIYYVRRVGDCSHDKARCINENVAFPATNLPRPVVAVRPPFSVVFTDRGSMMAAEG